MRSSMRFKTAAAVLAAASMSLTACSAGASAGSPKQGSEHDFASCCADGRAEQLGFHQDGGRAQYPRR